MEINLKRGWIPHDEGAFAQSAERVMRGELPHRDFAELYTGGLTFLHAFAFRHFGANLATLRYVLFFFALLWVPVLYWIASQIAGDWAAAGVTLLSVAWSVPNYSAAAPSWYNLFFATFGTAAVFLYLQKHSRGWLLLAGLCGGLSFLAKSTGLYFVAAILLFFLFAEQTDSLSDSAGPRKTGRLYSAFISFSLVGLIGLLALLVRQRPGVEDFVHFVLPGAALACLLILREQEPMDRAGAQRFAALAHKAGTFLLGVALPIAAFLGPYLRAHALGPFVRGVFVLPFRRLNGASMLPPNIATLLATLFVALLLAGSTRLRGAARWIVIAAAAGLGVFLFHASVEEERFYLMAWHAMRDAIPLLTLAGVTRLLAPERAAHSLSATARQQLFLLLSVTALCSLVQFPFSAAIYFCYVAPLVILAGTALVRGFPEIPRSLLAVLFVFYLLFAVFRFTPGFLFEMGWRYTRDFQTQRLNLENGGGLRVTAESARLYERLIPVIREHAQGGKIYAAPDCPEVYFLAGYANPTPTFFDFFEDPFTRTERVLRRVGDPSIRVLVINNNPSFSFPFVGKLKESLEDAFPEEEDVGTFEVRWRP